MQTHLFLVPDSEPEPRGKCAHPRQEQILTGNLFTGKRDLVCSLCNATIAPDFQTVTVTPATTTAFCGVCDTAIPHGNRCVMHGMVR